MELEYLRSCLTHRRCPGSATPAGPPMAACAAMRGILVARVPESAAGRPQLPDPEYGASGDAGARFLSGN